MHPNSVASESSSSDLTSCLNTNVSKKLVVCALGNYSSGLNLSSNQCANVTSTREWSSKIVYGSHLTTTSKEALKSYSPVENNEDEMVEDDDREDMEVNVGSPQCSRESLIDEYQSNNITGSTSSYDCPTETENSIGEVGHAIAGLQSNPGSMEETERDNVHE